VKMRSILRRRWDNLAQYQILLGWVGAPLLALDLAIQLLTGLTGPAVVLGMGLAVDAARREGAALAQALALTGAGLVLQQVLAPLQVWVAAEVAQRVDCLVSSRLVGAVAASDDLRLLESTPVVTQVRETIELLGSRHNTPGEAVAGALALVARYVSLFGAVTLLVWVAGGWVGLFGLVIALVNRLGQSFGFSAWSAVMGRRMRPRQRLVYLRDLATDPLVAREVRKLRLSDWLADRYRQESRRYLRPLWAARRKVLGVRFAGYALVSLVLGGVLLWVGIHHLTSHGAPSAGRLAILLQGTAVCILFGVMFPESDGRMQYGLIAWNALRGVEQALGTTVARPAAPAPMSDGAAPADVRLEGLTFSYTAAPVLCGVDLALPAGSSTALVGINGAGKSTLVKLLAGYYQPQAGQTLVDGVSLGPDRAREWQRSIAILFQDYLPYQLSLRDNVVMQSPLDQVDDALVASCLQQAGLGGVLGRIDHSLETPMSRLAPGGTDLSGGQWQRLALARASYAVRTGSRLLVMDEPTSQMDARGEAEFYQRFLDLTKGVTTLVISHRFSSVRRADRIAVLDGGVITELGNHNELVAAGGTYARMFAAQADRYGLS